jgi:hypothetical protein
MTLEDVMSFLETLEELFGEDYKKAKQIRIAKLGWYVCQVFNS